MSDYGGRMLGPGEIEGAGAGRGGFHLLEDELQPDFVVVECRSERGDVKLTINPPGPVRRWVLRRLGLDVRLAAAGRQTPRQSAR